MSRKSKRKKNTAGGASGRAPRPQRAAPEPPPRAADVTPTSAPRKSAPRAAPERSADRLTIVTGLAIAGVVLTGYLTLSKWLGAPPALCSAGGGCDIVQSSRWSVLGGVPIAFLGMLTYAAIGALAWRARRKPGAWPAALFTAFAGAGISVYLTVVSVVEIGATCGWCLTSLVLMLSVFALLFSARPAARRETFKPAVWLSSSGLVVASVVVVLHLFWSGLMDPAAGPEKPYLRGLATHLEASGARFYGTSWCPACQRQKTLFEASAKRLPFVECTPNGRGTPMSTACQAARVVDFPTWVIDGKRHVGVQQPERLATLSSFSGGS